MAKPDFDLIVIGAGSGGVRASRMAARYGARVAIIDHDRIGGTCVMRGCVPKKLLVIGSHFADAFEDAPGFGWATARPGFDWPTLIANKNKELDRLEAVYRKLLADSGVELIEGTATLKGPRTVQAGERTMSAAHILIATGGRPVMPKIPGIERAVTSNEALDLARLPDPVTIVGGGYIAVEFAGIFNALGSDVTLIIRAANILRGFDSDVRDALAGEMEKKGITIRRQCVVESIEGGESGYRLNLGGGGAIEAGLVMYATGRAPNTGGLGLTEAGVETDSKGSVVVDGFSQTTAPGIYAVGDVTDRINLTPVAIAEGAAVAETLFNGNPLRMDHDDVPSAVFSQPPVGSVGLSEAEASEWNEVDVYISRFRPMKHTLGGRDETTMMKLVVDRASDRVLGCHMVGEDAPEIIQGLAVAVKCKATKAQFDATVGIHPTSAEEFVTLTEKRPGRTAE
jgi:glutathione reductase (NADPH)